MIQIDSSGHMQAVPDQESRPASNTAVWTLVVLTAINVLLSTLTFFCMMTIAVRIQQAAEIVRGVGCALDSRNC